MAGEEEEEKDEANLSDSEEPSGPSNLNRALQRSLKKKKAMPGHHTTAASQFNWGLLVDRKSVSEDRSHRSARHKNRGNNSERMMVI